MNTFQIKLLSNLFSLKAIVFSLVLFKLNVVSHAQQSVSYYDFNSSKDIIQSNNLPKTFFPDFEVLTYSGMFPLHTIVDKMTLIYTGCGWQGHQGENPTIKKMLDSSNRQDIKTILAYWYDYGENDKINSSYLSSSRYVIKNKESSICEYTILLDKDRSILFLKIGKGKYMDTNSVNVLKNIITSNH